MKLWGICIILLWIAFVVILVLVIVGSPLIKNPDNLFTILPLNIMNTLWFISSWLEKREAHK